MSLPQSKANDLKKLSVWIISVYITANILLYLTGEYLIGSVNKSVHHYLNQFLVLVVVGIVIMPLVNSIQLIRKTDYRKNLQWLVLSALPFIVFLLSTIVTLT